MTTRRVNNQEVYQWLLAQFSIFEREQGEKPRYVTMNWRNFSLCASLAKPCGVLPPEEPTILGCRIFINPCISDELVHFTFERMM